jgi:serine protease inhibitor
MQHIRITGRPTYIFNYLFIYDIVVPKFKPQYHLNCQPRAIISLGLVRGFSKLVVYTSVQSHRCKIDRLTINQLTD